MAQTSSSAKKQDVRWFVWTIVFLVVVGVGLVSYIVFSDSSNSVNGDIVRAKPVVIKK